MIAYGSRVMNTAKETSDLDLFIVNSGFKNMRAKRLIDGIEIDIIEFNIETVCHAILKDSMLGNTYFSSVFKNGKVLLNKYETCETLYNLLDSPIQRKQMLNAELLELAMDHVTKFIFYPKEREFHFCVAADFLRSLYHTKMNYSSIQANKVFKIYENPKIAKENYRLNLPSEEFMYQYLNIFQEENPNIQKKYLVYLLKMFENEEILQANFLELTPLERKLKQIKLEELMIDVEDMLIKRELYKDALYYITIEQMHLMSKQIEVDSDFEKLYKRAIIEKEAQKRINILEKMFLLLEKNNHLDYRDYALKINF